MFKSTSYFRELCSRTTRVLLSGVLGLCLVFVFSWVLTANNKASALTSSEINYQARLLQSNGAIVPDGNYNVDFKLYSTLSTGGGQAVGTCTDTGSYDCLWEETYTGANVVTVKDGYLTVNLGSITSFPSTINWGSPLYLTMNIGGTGGSPTWDGEMSPRIQLTSVPYAFEANSALTATTLSVSNGGYTDILQLTNPTAASHTITAPDATGTICLQSSASCGFITGSGTAILQNGNSLGTTVVVGSTSAYGLNLITNNTAVESLSSTGAATFENTSNSAGALLVENLSGSSVFGVNTSTGQTVLGNNTTSPIAGSLVLDNGNNGTPATVTVDANGSQTSNYTITLPTTGASGGLCLESSTASTSSATTLQFNSCANNSPTISVDTLNTWPKSGTATSGTTATVSAFTPSTKGDVLLVTTSIPTSGGSVQTAPVAGISDPDVSNWNRAIVSPASGSALRVEMWYGVITNTASASLTVTYTGTITSGTAEVDVTELTAVGVSSATTWGVDVAGAATGTTNITTPVNMPNLSPSTSGELYYGFANDQSAGLGSGGSCPNVPSAGTTWTCTTSAGGQGNIVDYDLNAVAGTVGGYNGQIYLGSTAYNYSAVGALFVAFINSTAINNAVSTQEANFDVQAATSGSVAGVLEANGTGDSLDLQNSAGVVAASFNSTGSLTVGNTAVTNQTSSSVAFATPIVTFTVPNGYYSAAGQTITASSCSGTGADDGSFLVTAVTATSISVSNTYGVAGETGCVIYTGSQGIINLEDENTAGSATGEVSLEAGIPAGSSDYNYSLILPNTDPDAGLCLETSSSDASQLVFNSCASNNPSISLQTTVGYGNNDWDTHTGTSGTTTTLLTYPEEKGDLEVMSTQIPNGTSNGVTVSSVSGGGVTLWHKAAVNPGNSNVDRVEVWYGTITGISPENYASQTVSSTAFGTPYLTYNVPSGQPFITGEYITVTGCSGTGADNGSYPVYSFTTDTLVVSNSAGVAGETGCVVNSGWALTVTYTPSTPGAATEVSASEFTAVGVAPTSSWGIDTTGNSLISTATTSLSGPSLTASTSGELYYSYANEQTSAHTPEGYSICSGTPSYNCIATGQDNVIVYNDQTVLSNAYQSAWTVSPTALDSNTVGVLFEAFISSTAINNDTSVQEANFDVQAATSGSVAGVLQANAAGTADILDLYNGGGTKEFTVSNTGLTTIGDSATISLIQSAWANATASGTTTVSATSTLPATDWSTTQTKGDVVTLGIECASTSASVAEVTGGNVTNWYNVTTQSANGYDTEIWEGTIATTASATAINITYALTTATWSANCEVAGQEFSASVPSGATPVWSVTSTSNTITGTAASVPVPTMSATQYGELYWSYDVTHNAATEPALQAPYYYQLTGDSKTITYNTSFGPGVVVPPSNITQTSGTYTDVGMVLSASTGSNLTDNGGAIFTGSDAQTDLQVIGASGSGAAVLDADTLNNRVNIDGTLAILSSPVLGTPTASGSGSALKAYVTCYEVTAIDGTGDETTPSNEKCITPTAGQNVTFTWGAVPGAVSYRVYRTMSLTINGVSGSETFLYDATQLTFTDVGAYTPSGTIFPPSSTNAYGNSTVVNGATAGTASDTGIESNLQLTVGGNGSPTGQVYISGTLPSAVLGTATIGGNGEPFGLAVQGNYAYISFDVTDKLAVYDVTNPANPVLVGQANTLAAPWYLAVAGHYVYVTDRSGNALQIYDVSNPASPELVSTLTTDMNDPSAVFVSGNYAYISNAGSSTAGLEIVNVSNPYAPTMASIIPTGTAADSPWNVFVQGRYAYAVDSGSTTMYVIDVSSPTQPILDSTFTLTGDPSQVYVSGSYAYLSIGNDIQIVNINNPYGVTNADILATNTGGEDCTGTSASYLEGNYLYVACDNGSTPTVPVMGTMEQIDVTNPYSPVISGTVQVGFDPQTLWIQGRYAYVDDETGFTLSVFDLGGLYSSSIQAGGIQTGTLGVSSNALIGGTLSVGAGFTVGGSTDINGSLNAYGGAQIAGNVVVGASVDIPIPSSPTVAATCGTTPCTTYYFYGVSATDSNNGTTLMSQSGGPTEVSGVPPVDYVSNYTTLSDTTNYNTITIDPDQGTTNSITNYAVYTCKETSLSGTGTPPTSTAPNCGVTSNYKLVANIATASETAHATSATATAFTSPALTYNFTAAPSEVQYQKVTVTGCSSGGDNGTFVVTSVTAGTIVVYDTGGAAGATGCSIVGDLLAEDYGAAGTAPPATTTSENSTTAFEVNNAASVSILTVNTTAGEVVIGNGTNGDNVGYLLVLDNKTDSGADPTTEVDGAMYYNAYNDVFRCGVSGAWQDCAGGLASNSAVATDATCTTACNALISASLGANTEYPGKNINIQVNGVWSTTGAPTLYLGVYYGTSTTRTSDTLIGITSLTTFAPAGTLTSQGWTLDYQINDFTDSATGTVMGEGYVDWGTTASAFTREWMQATTTTTMNTTVAQNIYVFPVWGTSSASNTITADTATITSN